MTSKNGTVVVKNGSDPSTVTKFKSKGTVINVFPSHQWDSINVIVRLGGENNPYGYKVLPIFGILVPRITNLDKVNARICAAVIGQKVEVEWHFETEPSYIVVDEFKVIGHEWITTEESSADFASK